MKLNSYSILGIPVQNLTLKTASEEILELIYAYKDGESPYYVATLNADFLANVHSWGLTEPKNPELLKIIRESTLTTADGFPVILLSHLLRCPLGVRVPGADLIPELLELLNVKNRSVFLFGGEESVTRLAAKKIQKRFKGLNIKGIYCPQVYVEGIHLSESSERDAIIIEHINNAKPDVLLLCLGNPKQEIWFERVHHQLNVPVVIGIGGTLNFIAGKILRAPPEFQRWGMEWFWRLLQEPQRLILRYANDFIKLIWLGVPLLIYHYINEGLTYFFRKENGKIGHPLLFLSEHHSICTIVCPVTLDSKSIDRLEKDLTGAYNRDAVILDMRNTLHMDIQGIAFLIKVWIRAKKNDKKIYSLGIRWNVKLLLIFHKAWDLLRENSYNSVKEMVHEFDQNGLYEAFDQTDDTLKLAFLGQLDQRADFEKYFFKLTPMLLHKNCILDFSFCSSVDNTAIEFLLKIRQVMISQKKHLRIIGLNKTVKNELKAAKVYRLLTV